MRAGIPTPEVFACPSVGRWESYHFKEFGHFFYHADNADENALPESVKAAIRKLDKDHLFGHTGR